MAAAARKVFAELKAGYRIEIGFSYVSGPYAPIHEKIVASSLKELFKELERRLSKLT